METIALQGLHHMWLWISLMTQRESLHTLSRKIQATNSKLSHRNMTGYKTSKIHSSPMNGFLYGQDLGNTSDYFSASESQQGGYTSCPTTPLSNRRKFDFDFSKTSQDTNTRESYKTIQNLNRESYKTSQDLNRESYKTSQDLNRESYKTSQDPNRESYKTSQDLNGESYKTSQDNIRATHRSNSSSRLYTDRESTPRQPFRSSSLNRIPKLEKLTAPRIVETEIWKKEIYQKVTEEYKEYKYPSKLTKSGSLPNLPHYITSVDIQVVPSRTIKFPKKENKQSQHEKEILKLCGDIITELKPAPVNINLDLEEDENQSSYGKINKVCIKNQIVKPETNRETESKADKFVSVKNVQIEAEPAAKPDEVYVEIKKDQKDQVSISPKYTEREAFKPGNSFSSGGFFQDRISNERRFEKFEKYDTYDRGFETDNEPSYEEIDTESCVSNTSKHTYTISDDDENRKLSSDSKRRSFLKNYEDNNFGHFENLVNILQEAVNDISR